MTASERASERASGHETNNEGGVRFDKEPPFISPAKNHNLFRQHLSKPLAFHSVQCRRSLQKREGKLTNCEKASEADKTADGRQLPAVQIIHSDTLRTETSEIWRPSLFEILKLS